MQDKILILDFGSQFTQLIARRIRELQVFCEIVPFNKALQPDPGVRGIILSGSPASVRQPEAPTVQIDALRHLYQTPILGVCYGAQLMAHLGGGEVAKSNHREYGRAMLQINGTHSPLLDGIDTDSQVWMSHADSIVRLPDQFQVTATTASIPVAAFQHTQEPIYGIQFHPEVTHSVIGPQLLYNFVHNICGLQPNWTPEGFVEATVRDLQAQIGDGSVVCALSGGVDSTVAALLLHKAIGPRLHCIFVDNGLLRLHEYEQVLEQYQGMGLNVHGVDARRRFLDPLDGVADPETKRKTIGRVFIEVFEAEAKRLEATAGNIQFLAQGTIYPDVIESVSVLGPSVTIKSHHNVGGLPARMNLKVVEPLRMLFKDEVRRVGRTLGISPGILGRHPFPGPGLAIRVLGAVSEERLDILKQADHIYLNILRERGLYDQIWQAFSVLLPVQSVGVMGDERTYENVLAIRAVTSQDGMTADWFPMPYDALADISSQIINRVKGINRVVYDVSSKPPATIEWE